MRTSLDVPDDLFRYLKTRAAAEGSTLRELVLTLVQRGLDAEGKPAPAAPAPAALPVLSLGAPLAVTAGQLSNAALAEALDDDA